MTFVDKFVIGLLLLAAVLFAQMPSAWSAIQLAVIACLALWQYRDGERA